MPLPKLAFAWITLRAAFRGPVPPVTGTFGPPVYAATVVVLDAIAAACEGGEADRAAIGEQIAQTDQPESILGGPLAFDENGDVEGAEFYIFEISGGEYTLVE